jgi:hypothetical protein
MGVVINTVRSVVRDVVRPVTDTVQGSLLNYWANSEKITADSLHEVRADDEKQSIKLWFDYMNTEFEKLYKIYT